MKMAKYISSAMSWKQTRKLWQDNMVEIEKKMQGISRKKIEARRVNHGKTGNTAFQLDKMGREHLRRRHNLDEGSELKESLVCFSWKPSVCGGSREEGGCKDVSDERSLRPT